MASRAGCATCPPTQSFALGFAVSRVARTRETDPRDAGSLEILGQYIRSQRRFARHGLLKVRIEQTLVFGDRELFQLAV